MINQVLVIAAHPDDELLGVGGTIRKLVDQGVCCRAVILGEGITSRSEKREDADQSELDMLREDAIKASKVIGYETIDFFNFPDNRLDGVDLLDVVKAVSTVIDKYKPDTVFTHFHGDLNIDHRIVCEAVVTACRPVAEYSVDRIYAFETPSSTEWNYCTGEYFKPNLFFDVTNSLEAKIKGMQCYRSERTAFPHPRSPEALRALAQYRGSNVGFERAEAFMILREIRK
jgi:LmbE family N-acetylglucosaminyl deacetylase